MADCAPARAWGFYRGLIRELRTLGRRIVLGRYPLSAGDIAPLSRLAGESARLLRACPDALMTHFRRSSPEDYLIGKMANMGVLAGRLALHLREPEPVVSRSILTGWLLHVGLFRTRRVDLRVVILTREEKRRMLESVSRATTELLGDIRETDRCRELWALRMAAPQESGRPSPGGKKRDMAAFARILDVAEVYEALTHDRPNRGRMIPHEAVKFMIDRGGEGRFDQAVVKALIQSLSVYPPGSYVELNDGTKAVVCAVSPTLPTRPVLRTVCGRSVLDPGARYVDLGENTMLRILAVIDEKDLDLPRPSDRLRLRARLWWPVENEDRLNPRRLGQKTP